MEIKEKLMADEIDNVGAILSKLDRADSVRSFISAVNLSNIDDMDLKHLRDCKRR